MISLTRRLKIAVSTVEWCWYKLSNFYSEIHRNSLSHSKSAAINHLFFLIMAPLNIKNTYWLKHTFQGVNYTRNFHIWQSRTFYAKLELILSLHNFQYLDQEHFKPMEMILLIVTMSTWNNLVVKMLKYYTAN